MEDSNVLSSPGALAVPSMQAIISAEPTRKVHTPGRQLSRDERKEERRRGLKETALELPQLNLNDIIRRQSSPEKQVLREQIAPDVVPQSQSPVANGVVVAAELETTAGSTKVSQVRVEQSTNSGQILTKVIEKSEVRTATRKRTSPPFQTYKDMPAAKKARHESKSRTPPNDPISDDTLEYIDAQPPQATSSKVTIEEAPSKAASSRISLGHPSKQPSPVPEEPEIIDDATKAVTQSIAKTKSANVQKQIEQPAKTSKSKEKKKPVEIDPKARKALKNKDIAMAISDEDNAAVATAKTIGITKNKVKKKTSQKKPAISEDEETDVEEAQPTKEQAQSTKKHARPKKEKPSNSVNNTEQTNSKSKASQLLVAATREAIESKSAEDSKFTHAQQDKVRREFAKFSDLCDQSLLISTASRPKPKKADKSKKGRKRSPEQLRKLIKEATKAREAAEKELRKEEQAWQESLVRKKEICHLHATAMAYDTAAMLLQTGEPSNNLFVTGRDVSQRIGDHSTDSAESPGSLLSRLRNLNDALERLK